MSSIKYLRMLCASIIFIIGLMNGGGVSMAAPLISVGLVFIVARRRNADPANVAPYCAVLALVAIITGVETASVTVALWSLPVMVALTLLVTMLLQGSETRQWLFKDPGPLLVTDDFIGLSFTSYSIFSMLSQWLGVTILMLGLLAVTACKMRARRQVAAGQPAKTCAAA